MKSEGQEEIENYLQVHQIYQKLLSSLMKKFYPYNYLVAPCGPLQNYHHQAFLQLIRF